MTRLLDFSDVHLYGVTQDVDDTHLILDRSEKMLKGGIDALQLRSRKLSDKKIIDVGKELKELCHAHGALFLVNNRPDLALAIGADGVHLGHEDVPISVAREILGHRVIIGASTHSLPQAFEAQKKGADYVSCGPIWATPTKPEYEPVTLKLIGLYRAALKIPFVVIGGIDDTNASETIKAGATRMAVVRAMFDSADPEKAAKFFKALLQISPSNSPTSQVLTKETT